MELIIFGVFMCISFVLGRYTSNNTKEISPITNIKKKIVRKKDDSFKVDEATRIMLENIDNYDGSGFNQQDVPSESGDDKWI